MGSTIVKLYSMQEEIHGPQVKGNSENAAKALPHDAEQNNTKFYSLECLD